MGDIHSPVGDVKELAEILCVVDHLVHKLPGLVVMWGTDHELLNLGEQDYYE